MPNDQYNSNVSVDCVLFGFDGRQLNVLLVEKTGPLSTPEQPGHMKLPGRMIYENEDLDDAAADVLHTMTGVENASLHQFETFGAPNRTTNESDRKWLEGQVRMEIGRVITVGYIYTLRISTRLKSFSTGYNAKWWPVDQLPKLIFDHNEIIAKGLSYLRRHARIYPAIMFSLLPKKFTVLEFKQLYEVIHEKCIDIRNFHKTIKMMPYIKALDEKQVNVAHRAARYYKFDKAAYNKLYK